MVAIPGVKPRSGRSAAGNLGQKSQPGPLVKQPPGGAVRQVRVVNLASDRDCLFDDDALRRALRAFENAITADLRTAAAAYFLGGVNANPSFKRSEEHTSELPSLTNLVCPLLL